MDETFKNGIEIYNRLIWDERFNQNAFSIVIKDRIEGSKEVLLKNFDSEEVPWHRVIQFKHGDTVVWDRDAKIDLLSETPDLFAI